MFPLNDVQSRVAAVLATIAPEANQAKQLSELERLLVRSRIDDVGTLTPRELSIDRVTRTAPTSLYPDQQRRIDQLQTDAEPEFRVFRREVAAAAPMLDLAAPAWGRGALVRHSLGPFQSVDGRQFWFDFFPIVRLVPLYLAGDPRPALLFYLRSLGVPHSRARRRVRLAKSSLWIRANLLAAGAPSGSYVGLRIEAGSLAFSVAPTNVGGRLTLPSGSRCTVDLTLSPSQAPAPTAGQAGSDASNAQLTTPDRFVFDLQAGKATVTEVTRAEWKLYDQPLVFNWISASAPKYEPVLLSVLIPFKASENAFAVGVSRSPFAELAGQATIEQAAWTLPVALIDVNNPPEAAGDGGLAIHTAETLTLSWRGLRDGPIHLRKPWIGSGPGFIVVVDPHASNRYAHQRLRLWKDADSRFRSEMVLQFTDSFSVVYTSASSGNEVLLARTDIDARLDRPVDVKGTPFPIHTLSSLLGLAYSDAQQLVSVCDDNILVESLDPKATWPVQPGHLISLAIRNALFTITPVNSMLLFGELQDEETVKQASLFLGMGLFGLLPTLPDPYAANIRWLRRYNRDGLRNLRPSLLLVATVAWTKAAGDQIPDSVKTSFAFAPLGNQEQTIAVWTEAGRQQQAFHAAMLAEPGSESTLPPQQPATFFAFSRAGFDSNQGRWDGFFKDFENEQFSLLDVSTNADQLGVSFAWFNRRNIDERNQVFFKVYGTAPQERQPEPEFPLEVRELDLSAQSRFVRAFMLPQVSWEPLINLTRPEVALDPPRLANLYPNDGGPTRLFNNTVQQVPIEPIPVTESLVKNFQDDETAFTGALFTLPFGLRAFAEFSNHAFPTRPRARLELDTVRPEYQGGTLRGARQVRADAPEHTGSSPLFAGSTLQLNNVLDAAGFPTGAGTLGGDVGEIFNNQFFFDPPTAYKPSGVPLTRIDFSGYGANTFSHWEDPSAAIAATSKAYFDVFTGRTAQEVIQVRSLLYGFGVHVVRTITMTRASNGYVFRFDTGWQAETDGVYDFRYTVFVGNRNTPQLRQNPYVFHPGLVKGVFNVRNIHDASGVPQYDKTFFKHNGDTYLDSEGIEHVVDGSTPSEFLKVHVVLQPVYFDADVQIDGVISGAVGGRVPSTGMLGYVQLSPRGEPIPPENFAELLNQQFGALGGALACTIDIGKSGQHMRINRVDVNASRDGATPIFVSAARGALVLPKDGSWSVVQHNNGSGEVSPIDPQATVPLIRRGRLSPDASKTDTTAGDLIRVANPMDLVGPLGSGTRNYGLLQSTNTQKALFRLPSFQDGIQELKSAAPDFADSYRLISSKGIFPNIHDALPLNLGAYKTRIVAEGYKLLDEANPNKVFQQALPNGPLYLIKEQFLKLYVEYSGQDKATGNPIAGTLQYGLDATANAFGNQWLSKVNDITMVVDLGPLKRLIRIQGRFDAEKGADPAFKEPELKFGPELQPVIDILQILQQLQGEDYKGAFQKGLEVAMSNSANSWNYAFHARKEIPVVKFPPPALASPADPLKLEAHLAVGVYFNEALALPSAPGQLIPSAGAFLEFGGSLSVMCVSLAAATVYAVGMVDLRIAADIKTGPSLHMKFGFGAEIAVGLPVVGTVSLLYAVGVELDFDTGSITAAAFLLFRGRAELLEGLITVQIQIEAKGIYHRTAGETDLAAQVTFGLDVSVFLVINLHFSKSWQESRQIA